MKSELHDRQASGIVCSEDNVNDNDSLAQSIKFACKYTMSHRNVQNFQTEIDPNFRQHYIVFEHYN